MKKFRLPEGQLSFFDLPPVEATTETAVVVQPEEPASLQPQILVELPVFPLALPPYVSPEPPEEVLVSTPSVTFHKHKKRLLVKPNDVLAADMWNEIKARLQNHRMRNMQFFYEQNILEEIGSDEELYELWRWVLKGLADHPLTLLLESYNVVVHISPSLAGYMKHEKGRIEVEMAPFPCYESSDTDLSKCVQPGMILRCTINQAPFEKDKRYMVKAIADGHAVLHTKPMQGRTVFDGNGTTESVRVTQLNTYFEDYDKFVVESDIRDLFPERVETMTNRLQSLTIGTSDRLMEHSHQDVPCEALKRGTLCSKEMRMGKTREAIAIAEVKGSQKISWVGPPDAIVDIPKEFDAAGVYDYREINNLTDLEDPAKYHIFTFNFVKGAGAKKSRPFPINDPLAKIRRGNTEKTWLRAMGEEKGHVADCPHCGQTLERPVKTLDALGRIIFVEWITQNGYVCRNPDCEWKELQPRRLGAKLAATPWQRSKPVTHHGGYIDWERKQHANCGDHVSRGRACPKCGLVDSVWIPPIIKRIKKNYSMIIVDESHNCKDGTSKTSKTTLDFRGRNHLPLTGTPISVNLLDLYEPLMWAFKGPSLIFPFSRAKSMSEFKSRFCEDVLIQRDGAKKGHYKTLPYPKNPVDLWNFLSRLVVRRTRQDPVYLKSLEALNLKLPTSDPQVTDVNMVPEQAELMYNSIEQFKADFAEYCEEVESKGHSINDALVIGQMSRMKIAATIPDMLNRPGEDILYTGRPGGGKLICLESLIPAKIMEGKKVVLLSDFIKMRELLEVTFAHLNPVIVRSGTVAQKRRILDEFRTQADRTLLIAGPQQICQGLDLSCADVLVSCDLMWKAAKQNQALARLMGPTPRVRTVETWVLNSRLSIDEYVYSDFYGKIAGAQQALDHRVFDRTAVQVNWKAFADKIVEQQEEIAQYLRDTGNDSGIVMPDFMDLDDVLMERAV